MQAKALELRDKGTFVAILCVDMNPPQYPVASMEPRDKEEDHALTIAQRNLLRRVGYACDGRPNIIMTRLSGDGQATNDPYSWKGDTRTFPVAHAWIIEHWSELSDGDVVDVEYILGESTVKKTSERFFIPIGIPR